MDIGFIITASSLGLGLACAAYGIWQAKRVQNIRTEVEQWQDAANKGQANATSAHASRMKAEDRLTAVQADNDALKSSIRHVNEKLDLADAALDQERKAHSVTKGLLTKARNANSAQANAAAKKGR